MARRGAAMRPASHHPRRPQTIASSTACSAVRAYDADGGASAAAGILARYDLPPQVAFW